MSLAICSIAYRGIRSDAMKHIVTEAQFWCDDIGTEATWESCGDRSRLALERALQRLADEHGENMEDWRWGHASVAVMAHQPFDQVPLLRRLFSLVATKSGDSSSPDVAHYDAHAPFGVIAAASMRMIVDWSDPTLLRINRLHRPVRPPLSPLHHADMTRLWAEGRYAEIRMDAGSPQLGEQNRLLLSPKEPTLNAGG